MIEVLKLALEAFEIAAEGGGVNFHAYAEELRQAIAELESQKQGEPVACKECHLKDTVYDLLGDLKVANLKLSVRSQRTWVGLTDVELAEYADMEIGSYDRCLEVEAKLKEKNT